MKPKIHEVKRVSVTTVTGIPLLYDCGILYDDSEAYYDTWYPASSSPFAQGEIPVINLDDNIPRINLKED
jgi:hypothetical protein